MLVTRFHRTRIGIAECAVLSVMTSDTHRNGNVRRFAFALGSDKRDDARSIPWPNAEFAFFAEKCLDIILGTINFPSRLIPQAPRAL